MISLVAACAILLGLFTFKLLFFKKRIPAGTETPPGPKGIPVLGNLPEVPPYHSWLKFYEWSKKFGPLYRLSLFGRPHVIISSEKIANDLLRERGTIYSSRDRLPMAGEILSDNKRPVFLPYNDLWRSGRRLMHHLTMPAAATSYQPIQIEESTRMLRDLIAKPEDYERLFERYTAGLIMRLAYSKMVFTGEEPEVRRILEVVHTVERVGSPGAYLVDLVPSLMHLPRFLAPFKREGEKLHQNELDLFVGMLNGVRQSMTDGMSSDENFSSKFLSTQEKWGLSHEEGAYVIGTLFEAGSGTTAAAMMSFILAMVLHQDVLRALQKDIDEVVGDRLPQFEDIPKLPRVRAVVKETLRWRPVTAGGLPHMLTKDDVYELDGKRYFLEAGTNFHPNQWAIHRDSSLYPQSEDFIPDRWLDPKYPTYKEPLDVYPNIQNFSAFGFGRRICPGQNIAERSLNIQIARMAWACDIGPSPGVTYGEYDYCHGFNVQPNRFPFELIARKGRDKLVEEDYRRVWPELLKRNGVYETDYS
ncbi:cytochrome P450 [Xylogone sp. PMI_703]|nr:cytochrome P450 [Xylogone sp. PMI_703]